MEGCRAAPKGGGGGGKRRKMTEKDDLEGPYGFKCDYLQDNEGLNFPL